MMAMSEPITLLVSGLAGAVLGALFFGGLWWTVRRGVSSPRPALWFVGSLVIRSGLVLAGFYLVAAGQWDRLLLCVLGFYLARIAVMHLTRPQKDPPSRSAPETRHAPES